MHTIERFVATTISTFVLFATVSFSAIADEAVEYTPEDQQQLDCLTANIYHEAGGESYDGKVAVAQVTVNRVNSGNFPDSICGVVKQKTKISTGKTVCQFSWVCEHKTMTRKLTPLWVECYEIAKQVLFDEVKHEKIHDRVMYFHNNHSSPGWGLRRIARIGAHTFYSDEKVRKTR